jgi:hypothetical protein
VGWTYRKDWFARPEIQAAFKEKTGRDLTPPATFAELKEVAEFFQGREIDGKKVYGAAIFTERGSEGITMGVNNALYPFGFEYQGAEGTALRSEYSVPPMAITNKGEFFRWLQSFYAEYLMQTESLVDLVGEDIEDPDEAADAVFEASFRPTDPELEAVVDYAQGKVQCVAHVLNALKAKQPLSPAAVAAVSSQLHELHVLRSELMEARERARAQDDALHRREREQQQRAREQAHAAAVLERQAQAAAAMQQGLRDAGGQLVARMQRLKADVAERCQHVERTARDDVRRMSAGGGGGGP